MITFDSNIAVYAFTDDKRAGRATSVIRSADFLSVQVLSEFASVARRKQGRSWAEIEERIADLEALIPRIVSIDASHTTNALRVADRYHLAFYDALMLAVALSVGARTIYSEDMQHDLVIDGTLRILDPFR